MALQPTRSELIFGATRFRSPRYNSKGEPDSPESDYRTGQTVVALGLLAVAFAGRSMNRVRKEFILIEEMWSNKTTLSKLRRTAREGLPLPDTVLIKGTLTARGRPVSSIAAKIADLKPLMGSIEQPKNFFLDLGEKVQSGKIRVPKNFDLENKLKFDDVESVEDDFSSRQAILKENAFMAEQGSSTNAWLLGALASAVAGVALLATSRTRRTETTVAV